MDFIPAGRRPRTPTGVPASEYVHGEEVKIQLRSGQSTTNTFKEITTVATTTNKTRTASSNKPAAKSTAATPKTKSARFVELLRSGKSIAEVAKITGDGYAFIYGVAKRNGLNTKAANRRATRAVTIDRAAGTVTVATSIGPVVVFTDGRVQMPKRPRTTTPAAE